MIGRAGTETKKWRLPMSSHRVFLSQHASTISQQIITLSDFTSPSLTYAFNMTVIAGGSSERAVPSSTPTRESSQAIFSDENERRDGTPPSSPPLFPWEMTAKSTSTDAIARTITTSPTRPPRNAFSVLGKRKALAAASENARPKKKVARAAAADDETQMQMSLGQTVQKKCNTCGMEYTVSSVQDRKLHDKYHKQNIEGYDVGPTFVDKTLDHRRKHGLYRGVKSGDWIVFLDCCDSHHRRRRGQAVLEIVQRELGAVPIPENEIWDLKIASGLDMDANYKAFLYVRDTKCVGFLLAQKIEQAFAVVKPDEVITNEKKTVEKEEPAEATSKSSIAALKARKKQEELAAQAVAQEIKDAANHPLRISETKHPAVLGVSRIWTSSTHRGEGIAKFLLDTAIKRHNVMAAFDAETHQEWMSGRTSSGKLDLQTCQALAGSFGKMRRVEHKEQVAFSQPTESGAKLARKWYGKAYGWSVYVD